jgi:hypothetical protein
MTHQEYRHQVHTRLLVGQAANHFVRRASTMFRCVLRIVLTPNILTVNLTYYGFSFRSGTFSTGATHRQVSSTRVGLPRRTSRTPGDYEFSIPDFERLLIFEDYYFGRLLFLYV